MSFLSTVFVAKTKFRLKSHEIDKILSLVISLMARKLIETRLVYGSTFDYYYYAELSTEFTITAPLMTTIQPLTTTEATTSGGR